ncbi:MAG: response regulator, partial [Deltaproteobacteria bacterium]
VTEVLKGKEGILLVDDEDVIIDVGHEILKTLGYEVHVARSGREAIDAYEANQDKIDMVILDMIMPDMGGGEAYDTLKRINPDIKVLLSSGYSLNGQAAEILRRGCNGFIQKPFNVTQLSQKLREILE